MVRTSYTVCCFPRLQIRGVSFAPMPGTAVSFILGTDPKTGRYRGLQITPLAVGVRRERCVKRWDALQAI